MSEEREALGPDFIIRTGSWSNAVRVTHLPSGFVETCDQHRSQHRNKEVAVERLKERLFAEEQKTNQGN
jgi:protein subunit release factor A